MTRRLASSQRRHQVVEATLALLATTPIDRITTRQIARKVGMSQPALFRHFRSREAILQAVVSHARGELERLAAQALARQQAPLEALQLFARSLLGYVERNPGMPRLLFHQVAKGESAPYHRPLAHLVSMQRSLVAELVREAQRQGQVSETVDPRRAAALFVALVQGVLLQWQLSESESSLGESAAALIEFWLSGVRGGAPAKVVDARGQPEPPPAGPLATLDVRPLLAAGSDPLERILEALEGIGADGLLKLTAPFRPAPLLVLLKGRGFRCKVREVEPALFEVEIQPPGACEIEDLRDLPAPEPLERVLEATAQLAPGAAFLARVPRYPRLLLPRLEERGIEWAVHEEPDQSALLYVRKPA
jgi:AcrR family transcriptional regulator